MTLGAFGEQRRGHQFQNTVLGTTDDDLTYEPATPVTRKRSLTTPQRNEDSVISPEPVP